jgi:ElaB/YqjD/DUF883 family membrane-anchored ribosome-binding protein
MSDTAAAKHKLTEDFRAVMDDIDSLMKSSGEKLSGEQVALRQRIRDRMDAAKERAADLQYEAVARAKDAARATDDYVHDHPWTAVSAAAAIGLALGVLIGRR